MENEELLEECSRILKFWRLMEYFTPLDYPELVTKVKEYNKEVPFDVYYRDNNAILPLNRYETHNDYLHTIRTPDNKLYNRANIYYGCYEIKTFVRKMAEECKLDLEKYLEIDEMTGVFYIFSVQVDLNGNLTDEGVQISPFFYSIFRMIKEKDINVKIKQEDILKLNSVINEILKQDSLKMSKISDISSINKTLFNILRISSEEEIGLQRNKFTKNFACCKGLRKDDETSDFNSFYLEDIEIVEKNYKSNELIIKYISALLYKEKNKVMIDNDIKAMKEWLDVDKFPLAKYPSKFSPTLMQQVAINIALSENDKHEDIFSVNGPPGTGKTTLLKEIIASNVEQLAEKLIEYGIQGKEFSPHKVESASRNGYIEKYYEIPEDIAKYGILVVSNNNGAVENITLDLPKANGVTKDKTRTTYFDREENGEIYFSAIADKLLGEEEGVAWGLISARMGRKKFISDVLSSCIFARKNDNPKKVTLDLARDNNMSWDKAVADFKLAKKKVLLFREEIKRDKEILFNFYKERDELEIYKEELANLILDKEQDIIKLDEINIELRNNEKETLNYEEEIKYIKKHSSAIQRVLILFHLGKFGKRITEKQRHINELINYHEKIVQEQKDFTDRIEKISIKIKEQNKKVSIKEKDVSNLNEVIYGKHNSLKVKYKSNLADREFYKNIKSAEESQNSCPWTFDEYDTAREELFYAALQVRKAFILESPYIRRNLFVYQAYNNGKYTLDEKKEMFPHLINSLSIVIPVLSSTFASVGRFLKHAGNKSLGMLVIDESGQATPQSAIGAIYRTKKAVVVGDPLQVEPVVTIPQVIIDMLADNIGVAKEYKLIENSVQVFADNINEFSGMIGNRQVGCPLVVHRRCIEPMFSISNMISYDNRMFNKTNKKEEFLSQDKPFILKQSGWIDVKGDEEGTKNHFVKEQAKEVCKLLDKAMTIYEDLFDTDDKIFIISPFKTVVKSMRQYVIKYFYQKGNNKKKLEEWTRKCIGTVHTFQGKDANEVLFVLGCSDKSVGAMNWVVNKANILNVACTRAKYRIAFIGNMTDWKDRSFFSDFIPKLIDKMEA